MTKEICQDCERVFLGGPKAFLCPECRKKRQRKGQEMRRKKDGTEKNVCNESS